jgi:hypothetical protein
MAFMLLSFTFMFYLLIYWAWLALMMMSVVYGMGFFCFSCHQIANQIGQGWVRCGIFFFSYEYRSYQYGPRLAGNK